jgi:GTP:adenosylcobinamide-phosphate guanylyltransferase
LIEANQARVARVEFPEGAVDIDTPADLQRLSMSVNLLPS